VHGAPLRLVPPGFDLMCVCMYVCVCVHVCVLYAYVCACVYIRMLGVCLSMWIQKTHTYTHVHTRTHTTCVMWSDIRVDAVALTYTYT